MDTLTIILIIIAAGAVIGVMALLWQTGVLKNAIAEKERLAGENEQLKSDLTKSHNEHQALSTKYEVLRSSLRNMEDLHLKEISSLKSHNQERLDAKDLEHKNAFDAQERRHAQAVESMKETFNQTVQNLKANMQAATEDLLKHRQEEFSDLSQKNMKDIVTPLNETIEKMKQAMEGYSREQSEFSGTMKTNIEAIIKQTETARQSTQELTTALKHDTKVQGDYGEVILDELLTKQGFTRGIHYDIQDTLRDENGKALKDANGAGLRPDVILHLDTKRDVIIDSKMNLTEFIQFANAETPEERQGHLEKHVRAIEAQVKLLSQKDYSKYNKKTDPRMDYVIMFVPVSAAYWEALRLKPTLWRDAMERNVYIADEQTLFAALRIIRLTWTQIAQSNNQAEIFDLANQMIERVGQFMNHYTKIGDALVKAQAAYQDGEKKLAPTGHSILTTARQLLDKGAQDSKNNPVGRLLDIDQVEQLPTA